MKTFTIAQFRERFSSDDACLQEIFRLRFGHLNECPKCSKPFDYRRVTSISKKNREQRKSFQCSQCAHQLYPLVGTIYEKSRTPLTYWFYAIYMYTATRNGVAAKELERQLGVTYKTAFRMAHRIRQLMRTNRDYLLSGVIQIDEAWIGGRFSLMNKQTRKRLKFTKGTEGNKTKVLGMINDEKTAMFIIDKISEKEILPLIIKNVAPDSVIVTDGETAYEQLPKLGYSHVVLRHDKEEFARDGFHGNSIEGFWSQLKRTIRGTHIHVSKKYLQNYVDECSFRYEWRKRPTEMFDVLLEKLS